MSDMSITFTIDDVEVEARPGQTILEAAEAAGIYIPRLCAHKELVPFGSCRICTVKVNGRPQAACTQPVSMGAIVENETDEIHAVRKGLVEMLFVEGNHICPFCERSGDCELQALSYRFGIAAPRYPYLFPKRDVDATHEDVMVDQNRCVLCARCVRASRDIDGKNVFEFTGRSTGKMVAPNGAGLADTDIDASDKAVEVCPVGALLKKRVGYKVPVGNRPFDQQPIGSQVEQQPVSE